MALQNCNLFEPTTNTSSEIICKWCGQGKFTHSNQITETLQTPLAWLLSHYKLTELMKKANQTMEVLEIDRSLIKKFNVEQMMEKEPVLVGILAYVKHMAKKSKTENIDYYRVWLNIKRLTENYVGDEASDPELGGSENWDLWTGYLLEYLPALK